MPGGTEAGKEGHAGALRGEAAAAGDQQFRDAPVGPCIGRIARPDLLDLRPAEYLPDLRAIVDRQDEPAPDDWMMTSDNGADWPPRPVGEGDRVLGRVVRFGPEKALVAGG